MLKELWMEKLKEISQGVAQCLASLGNDLGFRLLYVFNGLRIWFAPNATIQAGTNRSLAEDPCPKHRWYSTTDIMAFTFPTMPDSQVREEPTILLGPGSRLQERYDDPEVQGRKIARIAFKQMKCKSHRTLSIACIPLI
jgi:hypothetical protein